METYQYKRLFDLTLELTLFAVRSKMVFYTLDSSTGDERWRTTIGTVVLILAVAVY